MSIDKNEKELKQKAGAKHPAFYFCQKNHLLREGDFPSSMI